MPNPAVLFTNINDSKVPIYASLSCSGAACINIQIDSDRRYYFLHNQLNENAQADTHTILIGTLSGVAPLANLISQSNVLQINALSSTALPFIGPGLSSFTFLAINKLNNNPADAFPTFTVIPSEKFYGGY